MGRKSTITVEIKKDLIKLSNQKIKKIFSSIVRPNSSGGYIPLSQEFNNHRAYVIVLEEKNE